MKSDFNGQWNHHWNNVYGYVGSCFNDGMWLAFYNNTCIVSGLSGKGFTCPDKSKEMSVFGNKVYNQDGTATTCNGTSGKWPSDATVTDMGTKTLAPFPFSARDPAVSKSLR